VQEKRYRKRWTQDESDKLLSVVGKHGPSNWTAIAKMV